MTTIDARTLSVAEYKAAKKKISEHWKLPKPAPVFDKDRLAKEIADFEASGKTSPMSANTSNMSPTPKPAEPPAFRSANDMSDAEYQQARRDIANGKIPALVASNANHA